VTPKEDIFSRVVGMETIHVGFLLAAMNGLDICAADIRNAFLYGHTKEKVYIIARKEFGKLSGEPLIIDKGLYGLRSSGARFHKHLSHKLRIMGYSPTKADPDLWIKSSGTHYEYIATYVDDVLCFGKDPMTTIKELQCDYILKGIGKLVYLGCNICEVGTNWQKENVSAAMSTETYIRNSVSKYELLFDENSSHQWTPTTTLNWTNWHCSTDNKPPSFKDW